jgi:thioredoxin 1
MTAEAFQRDVLDRYAIVAVGFGTDDPTQQEQLQAAGTVLRAQTSGQLPWVNVLAAPEGWTENQRNVRTTPAIVAYSQGREVSRLIGPFQERRISDWLQELDGALDAAKIAAKHVPELVLTNENFDLEMAAAKTPVLVDFWAAWCGPCLQLEPELKLIAIDYEARLRVGKLDIDQQRDVARRFVTGPIPLLVLMHRGREVDRLVGARPGHLIRQWLDAHLAQLAEHPDR